jgi:hypothetical protein
MDSKMFRANRQNGEQSDRAGRLVLLAAARNDDEVEAAASSPFLYPRLRARIAEEEERRREAAGSWGSLLFVARRAIPAMALVAILAAILTVWTMQPSAPAPGYGLEEEALMDARDPGVEQTILTRNALTRDEVFSIVVERNGR